MFRTSRLIRSFCTAPAFVIYKRNFLPSTYSCNSLWTSRLSHEAFQNLSARDLGISILKAMDTGAYVSPLDYDIFTNKMHELDIISIDFIEGIIERYSHTQSALTVVDSTSHAIVRAYIDLNQPLRLVNLAQRRASTGVFLDPVSANLLLNLFIDQHEWVGAINVVWELYLQEYFSPLLSHAISPFTVACALHSCNMLIGLNLKDETADDPPQTSVDETSELDGQVEYKFVKYVRNPNYDSLFDIHRPRLKLGFILVRLSDLMERRPEAFFINPGVQQAFERYGRLLIPPLRLFGLAYSDQLVELHNWLKNLSDQAQLVDLGLSVPLIAKLILAVENATVRSDNTPIGRGEPVLPTSTDVERCIQELQRLHTIADGSPDVFHQSLDDFVRQGILNDSECVDKEIATVEQLYTDFEAYRSKLWNEHVSAAHKERVFNETKHSLRSLLDEEERLNYFRNHEKIIHQAWLAPRTREERRWSQRKEWKRDIMRHYAKNTPNHQQTA